MRALRGWACLLLLVPLGALAADGDVENPKEYFMRLCLKDMTVAAGKRVQMCECVRDMFAYGDIRFGLSDAISLDPQSWEAPEKRMPQDELGSAVRNVRRQCLLGQTGNHSN